MKTTTLAVLALSALTPLATAGTYHLYYFGGQSNMVGFGRASELPEDMQGPVDHTRIFFGQIRKDFEPAEGVGCWSDLTPGFGVGARTDGVTPQPSDRFGPELAFARRMRELRPDDARLTHGGDTEAIPRQEKEERNSSLIASGNYCY